MEELQKASNRVLNNESGDGEEVVSSQSSIDRAAIEKEVEERMREKMEMEYLEKEKLKDVEAQKRLSEVTQLAEQAQAKLIASEKKAAEEKAARDRSVEAQGETKKEESSSVR